MSFKVVQCPNCRRILGTSANSKTFKCRLCGKSSLFKSVKILDSVLNADELVKRVQFFNEKELKS